MIPYRALVSAAENWGDRTIFILEDGLEISFEALLERVNKLASALEKRGLEKGDVLAVLLPNCIEFIELYIAAGSLGMIFQPMDIRFRGKELANALKWTDAKVLAAHAMDAENIDSLDLDIEIKLLIGGKHKGWQAYEGFLGSGTSPRYEPEMDEDMDNSMFIFTSGSTGAIKCVPVTWRQLDFFPQDLMTVTGINPVDRGISLVPMSHISGPIVVNLCLVSGSSYIITSRFTPLAIVDMMETFRVTWTHTVPPIASLILKGISRVRDLSSMRFIALMGTSVSPHMLVALEHEIPSVKAIQGYGLTETSPLLTLLDLEHHADKRGSIGKALPGSEIKILDESGHEVVPGEPGEIVVSGERIFKGYYKDPGLSASVIRDGWFHTGDIARVDRDGFYYHLGRMDDVINVGGLKVYPIEIENALLQHPLVQDCVAYGIPDKKRGHVVAVDVVPKGRHKLIHAELRRFLLGHLAEYKIPTHIRRVKEIRLTATGKPIRRPRAQ